LCLNVLVLREIADDAYGADDGEHQQEQPKDSFHDLMDY
jgi:hypothetical protein